MLFVSHPLSYVVAPVLAGSIVYCALSILAARRYLRVRPPMDFPEIPISILKPLAGRDEGLEENLRSFFEQDYTSDFEILFAVRHEDDRAIPVVLKLQAEFPHIPSRLLITGDPTYPNAKVFSLDHMYSQAKYQVVAMADSDVRVEAHFLRTVAAEFADAGVGLATCPYRAVPGASIWSRLEAAGMNTEFLSGLLVARLLEGVRFAVGPTIVARRATIDAIGGFERVKDYLAEDFMLGKLAAETGCKVILSSYVIEHRIGSQNFRANFRHRLRWCRSTRRSRPAGYVGQVFTNPIPIAFLLWALEPTWWPAVIFTCLLRADANSHVAGWVLRDPLVQREWWLVPIQDFLSLAFWIAGFFGNTISWRGRRYFLHKDGTFTLIADAAPPRGLARRPQDI